MTALATINTQLDRLHRGAGANEAGLRQLLIDWRATDAVDAATPWLVLARIAELTLLTAGAYADGCEFQAAGDLLVNPAKILIRLKGRREPVTKPRHVALSTALRPMADGHQPFIKWFRANALIEETQGPLLPKLAEIMAASGRIAPPWLADFTTRMEKVAETIGFLNAWKVEDAADLALRLKRSSPDTRSFIEANLCRFGDAHFMALGALIKP
jgi:hypothetical protein